uniref:Copper type II ascorbate-dependent monooxygenase C-terminal domain-containing protein n=1 Tax=Bionectria ochroleuca TaxID=29856 RepID=A0A8H7NQZ7_BIOOC
MLITTCEFETTGDTEPVKGGLSSQQEMCFSWVDYYPANSIMMCSQFDLGNSTRDGLTGVVGFCSDSSKPEAERFASTSITSPFEALPETGKTCNASNSTGTDSSDNAADDSAASSSLPNLTLLITMLSMLGLHVALSNY